MPALFRPFVNVVGREFEAKGFCFVLGVERTGRVNPVAYRDLRNPFAGLCIKSGRRNHDPAFVKLELIDELVNDYQPYAIVVEDHAGKGSRCERVTGLIDELRELGAGLNLFL